MMNRALPAALLLIAIGIFIGYVRPTYAGSITDLRTQVTQYNAALDAADRYNTREAELAAERNKLPPDALARLATFLPDGIDNVRMILDLTALASRSGVGLSGFTVTGGAPADGSGLQNGSPVDSVDLSVTATGTYSAFRTFLTGIETSLRPMDVMNLKVKASATGVYTYAMTLRIYWLR
jgi:hypothetical protein